jgi:beta-lactamase superfamily II metal-dependent hydrolase
MKKIIVIMLLSFMTAAAGMGALLKDENFDYSAGDDITSHGWTHHSGSTGIIFVTSPGLSYSGYISSGIGNAADVDTTGYDDNTVFSDSVLSGPVYAAFMVNAGTNGAPTGYFFHLAPPTTGTSYFARVWGQNSVTDSFKLGISKSSEPSGTYSTVNFAFNRTYLVVVKYMLVGGTLNDTVSLYVFDAGVPTTEPATPTVGPYTNTGYADATKLGSVCLRQYSATQNYLVDGIRVGTTWADVCPPTSAPYISLTPNSLDLGTVLLADTSAEASYTVSGDNLTAGITVTAPSSEFKVSLTSGSGYASSVVVPRDGSSDSIAPRDIYVIFNPASEGAKSGDVTNTSTGADPQNVAVSGYGTKIRLLGSLSSFGGVEAGQISSEQFYTYKCAGLASGQPFTVTAPSQYQVSWSSGSGFASSVSQTVPADGKIPTDTVYVRFAPSATGTAADSISHVSTGATTRYQGVYGRGVAAEPTLQASNITFSAVDSLKMTVNWTRGDGQGCLLVACCENPVSNVPWDGYYYAASDSFGKGSAIGTGNYVVYKGTGSSAVVNKLYGISTYHFAVFEYNGTDSCENYLTSTYPAGNQITKSMSGKISLSVLGTAYGQDFNTLDTVPVPDVLPQGWNFREEGSSANYSYAENNGNLNTGNVYSYGMTDSVDRALGGLQTSSLVPTLSAVFTNNTGGTLTAIDIGYWGELWRLGLQRYDSLKFELSTSPGTWVPYPALNFVTPETTDSYGPRDGNNWLYRNYCWASISGLSIPSGGDFRMRWLDANAVSYDDGLAIDDVSVTPFNGRTLPRIIYTSPYDTAVDVAVNAPIKIGFSDTMNTSSFAYSCSPNPGGWSASWNSPRNDTVTLTHSNFAYWTNYTFTVTQARDLEGYDFVAGPCANPVHFRTEVDPAAPPMYITFMNAHQGDAIVIRSPTGKRILIDGGRSSSYGDTLLSFIKDSIDVGSNLKYLDYNFISHYHSDHLGGTSYVISNLDSLTVGSFDRGNKDTSGTTWYDYVTTVNSKFPGKRQAVTIGQSFDIGYGASIQVICFNGKTLSGDSVVISSGEANENRRSLGLLINYANKFKMVTCGDISKTEENILAADLGGRISVLKANHHGSNGSSGLKWVTELNPMITLIPVGDGNSYGHVHIEARDSLLADPKGSKAVGDSNRLYRTELGSGALCVGGRDTSMYENIHIEVTPNASTVFRVLNDGRAFPALAVELTSFTAMLSAGNCVNISWRTESETDCYGWEISRSTAPNDGYAAVGTVPGRGTSTVPHEYSFADNTEKQETTLYYKLTEIGTNGQRKDYGPVSVNYRKSGVFVFLLEQSRPNPYGRGNLTISYSLNRSQPASLKIYNILGQEVKTLFDGQHQAGAYNIVWNGRDNKGREVSSGVYYYRLTSGGSTACKKMVIIR